MAEDDFVSKELLKLLDGASSESGLMAQALQKLLPLGGKKVVCSVGECGR